MEILALLNGPPGKQTQTLMSHITNAQVCFPGVLQLPTCDPCSWKCRRKQLIWDSRLVGRFLIQRQISAAALISATMWCPISSKWVNMSLMILLKPTLSQFDPESLHMCTKLSGQAAQFSRKEKFDSIVRFLSDRWQVLFLSYDLWQVEQRALAKPWL